MCFGGGGGVDSGDQVVQAYQAQQMGELNTDHQKRYKHNVERATLNYIKDDSTYDEMEQRSLAQSAQQYGVADQMAARDAARAGRVLTAEQQQAMDAQLALGRTAGSAHTANAARAAEAQLKDSMSSEMMSLGRQNMTNSMGMVNQLASQEQARGVHNAQVEQQQSQALVQGIAMIAASIVTGGAAGVAMGAMGAATAASAM